MLDHAAEGPAVRGLHRPDARQGPAGPRHVAEVGRVPSPELRVKGASSPGPSPRDANQPRAPPPGSHALQNPAPNPAPPPLLLKPLVSQTSSSPGRVLRPHLSLSPGDPLAGSLCLHPSSNDHPWNMSPFSPVVPAQPLYTPQPVYTLQRTRPDSHLGRSSRSTLSLPSAKGSLPRRRTGPGRRDSPSYPALRTPGGTDDSAPIPLFPGRGRPPAPSPGQSSGRSHKVE